MLSIGADVSAVDRKAGNDFAQRVAQALQGKVSRAAVLLGNAVETAGEHVEFAGHGDLHDQALALVDKVGVTLRPSRELAVQTLEDSLPRAVDEHAVEKIQETVTGSSFNRPTGPQVFIPDQNLFRGDVEMATNAIGGAGG